MATYNGELYIEEQLSSILHQLSEQDELIISDDHSTDTTVQKIKSFQDTRIKLFTNKGKKGPVRNFENALKQASGEVIFLADQDDCWLPHKVKTNLVLLQKYDLILSDAIVINGSSEVMHNSFYKKNYSGKGFLFNWVNNSYLGCCMAFNKNVLNYVLPFPEKIAMHDIWIGLNASFAGKCLHLKEPLIKYRQHGKNTVVAFKKTHLPVSYQISYRLYMMYHIIKRRFSRRFK
jgi:glycosyltransferase involved in cell wall biosynthesis